MKRSDFLKKLCTGVATAIVAPIVIVDNLKKGPNNPHCFLKEPFNVPESELNPYVEKSHTWYDYQEVEAKKRFDEAYAKYYYKVELDFWFKNG